MKYLTVKIIFWGILLTSIQYLSAEDNLVKNGGFEKINPKKAISHGSSGYVVNWSPLYYPAQGFKAGVSNDAASGKNSVYLENHIGKKSLTWLSSFIPASKGEKLLVAFSMKTEKLQAEKDWHKPGVIIIFYDKNKQRICHRDVKRFGSNIEEWTKISEDFTVPNKDKIAFMRLGLVISYCKGKVFFDDVSIKRKVKKEFKASSSIKSINIFPAPKVVNKEQGSINISGISVNWSQVLQSASITAMKQLFNTFLKKKDTQQVLHLS